MSKRVRDMPRTGKMLSAPSTVAPAPSSHAAHPARRRVADHRWPSSSTSSIPAAPSQLHIELRPHVQVRERVLGSAPVWRRVRGRCGRVCALMHAGPLMPRKAAHAPPRPHFSHDSSTSQTRSHTTGTAETGRGALLTRTLAGNGCAGMAGQHWMESLQRSPVDS